MRAKRHFFEVGIHQSDQVAALMNFDCSMSRFSTENGHIEIHNDIKIFLELYKFSKLIYLYIAIHSMFHTGNIILYITVTIEDKISDTTTLRQPSICISARTPKEKDPKRIL